MEKPADTEASTAVESSTEEVSKEAEVVEKAEGGEDEMMSEQAMELIGQVAQMQLQMKENETVQSILDYAQ